MADKLHNIYDTRAADYERLVAREDYEGNIARALNRARPLQGLDVVELGAGTGRLTCLLAPIARTIRAFDASAHMLEIARAKLASSGLSNWELKVARHNALPVESASADVVVAGWSLVYSAIWAQGDWRQELGEVMAEIRRVLRPGGAILILETMGTGFEQPHPPEPLHDYFEYLKAAGYKSDWFRTDYCFKDKEEGRELAAFFFGEEMTAKVTGESPAYLPECTGIWWQTA